MANLLGSSVANEQVSLSYLRKINGEKTIQYIQSFKEGGDIVIESCFKRTEGQVLGKPRVHIDKTMNGVDYQVNSTGNKSTGKAATFHALDEQGKVYLPSGLAAKKVLEWIELGMDLTSIAVSDDELDLLFDEGLVVEESATVYRLDGTTTRTEEKFSTDFIEPSQKAKSVEVKPQATNRRRGVKA